MERRTSPAGEGLCRYQRLRRRPDFVRCYRLGGKRHGSLVSIHFHVNEAAEARLGITASRKVGKSVTRQRLKRWVREIFRRFAGRDRLPTMDVVVHLKPAAAEAQFTALRAEVERLLTALTSLPEARR